MTDHPKRDPGAARAANQRGAARLAAVQALYQMDIGRATLEDTLAQFGAFHLGREIEGEQYLPADADFFRQIVSGVTKHQLEIDPSVDRALSEGWPIERVDATLRAILRAAAFELLRRKETSPVELTEACLARIDRHNKTINAFITVAREQALAAAREMEVELRRGPRRGPLLVARAAIPGGGLHARGAPLRAASQRRDALGVELIGDRLERYVVGLESSSARGRSVSEVLEDEGKLAELAREVRQWADSYEAPSFSRDEKNLVKLRSFLSAKLPA